MSMKKKEKDEIANMNSPVMSKFGLGGLHINKTGLELVIGNIIYYVIVQILVVVFSGNALYDSIGLIAGVVISTAMTIHMTIAVEQAMSLNERAADKHVKKTTAFRMLGVMAALVIVGLTEFGNIVFTLIGVMALKVSAYLQPLTHKVLEGKFEKEGR